MKGEGGNKAKGCVYINLTAFFASSRDDDTINTYTIHQYDVYYICVVTPIRSCEKKEMLAKGELLKCLVLRLRRDKIQLFFCSSSYNTSIPPTNNGFIKLSRRIGTRQT